MKKSGYKYQIEQALLREGWEIKTIDSTSVWWDDEHWEITYKHNPVLSFYLYFIVDPMFEGEREKGQGIYEVKASTSFPNDWNDNRSKITSISMTKRKFDDKLKLFLEDVKRFKKDHL
jgi:hypothetical protein